MNVAPLTGSHGNPFGPKNIHAKPSLDAAAPQAADGDLVEVDSADAVGTGDKTPGVIRLLEAGHFKGVADVRLRINFHDQLAAAATAAAKPVAVEAAGGLAETIGDKLDELAAALALGEDDLAELADLKAAFAQSASEATDAFAADGLAGEALTDQLTEAFETLTGSLEALLIAPAAEPEAVANPEFGVPAADVADPIPDGETLLADLAETFGVALAAVIDGLSTDSFLPELSPPTGNGVAYEKFLAQYTQLLGSADANAAAPDPLDVEA